MDSIKVLVNAGHDTPNTKLLGPLHVNSKRLHLPLLGLKEILLWLGVGLCHVGVDGAETDGTSGTGEGTLLFATMGNVFTVSLATRERNDKYSG